MKKFFTLRIFKFIFLPCLLFYLYIYMDDRSLERAHNMANAQDKEGVMTGQGPIAIKKGSKNALIIVHGFTCNPSRFHDLIEFLNNQKLDIDIYAPLLPFHGRSLEDLKNFDNQKIKGFVENFLKEKEQEYDKIILIGESYGGLLLTDILHNRKDTQHLKLILSSPGFYIKGNTWFNNASLSLFSPFMDYSNSPWLKMYSPALDDEYTAKHSTHARRYPAKSLKALKGLLEMDNSTRQKLKNTNIPYTLIMAKNDSVIGVQELEKICNENKLCKKVLFSEGDHMVYWGKYSRGYEKTVQNLIGGFIK